MNESVAVLELPKTPEKFRFKRALDAKGQAIEGLWIRNERFYAQARINGNCRYVPLYTEDPNTPVRNTREALAAQRRLLVEREQGHAPLNRRSPSFSTYYPQYLKFQKDLKKKTELTLDKERLSLQLWAETLGNTAINQISIADINRHLLKRKEKGLTNRTLNLDVIALGNVLRFAKDEKLVKTVVTDDFKTLDHKAPVRALHTEADIEKLCTEALCKDEAGNPVYVRGQQLADYIRFMCASGARRESALWVKWSDISFERRQLTLVKNKYSKANLVVTFNAKLEALLLDMQARRRSDSDLLFPDPHDAAQPVFLRKTFETVRDAVGLKDFSYHSCRHFFASHCVMSGIDTLTIAKWLGHADGGMLIGKVYGHLSDEHLQAQADKLSFGKPTAPAFDITKMSAADLLSALSKLTSQSE